MAPTALGRMNVIGVVLFDFDYTPADLGDFVRWSEARRELMALHAAGVVLDDVGQLFTVPRLAAGSRRAS